VLSSLPIQSFLVQGSLHEAGSKKRGEELKDKNRVLEDFHTARR
jgi:hypothetical protein